MSILATIGTFVGGLFGPVNQLVDRVVTTEKDKLTLRNELEKIQAGVEEKLIELEKAHITARKEIEVAEAGSTHWIRANWRPIISLTLVAIIVCDSFGLVHANEQIYQLSEIFLGLTAGSRGLEKIATSVASRKK